MPTLRGLLVLGAGGGSGGESGSGSEGGQAGKGGLAGSGGAGGEADSPPVLAWAEMANDAARYNIVLFAAATLPQ